VGLFVILIPHGHNVVKSLIRLSFLLLGRLQFVYKMLFDLLHFVYSFFDLILRGQNQVHSALVLFIKKLLVAVSTISLRYLAAHLLSHNFSPHELLFLPLCELVDGLGVTEDFTYMPQVFFSLFVLLNNFFLFFFDRFFPRHLLYIVLLSPHLNLFGMLLEALKFLHHFFVVSLTGIHHAISLLHCHLP